MLLGHIEEQDEVLHCQFSDSNDDDEESEGEEKSEIRYVDWFHKHHCMMEKMYTDVGFFLLKYLFHLIQVGSFC